MKKKTTLLNFLVNIILVLGYLLTLFFISFCLVVLIRPSHENELISESTLISQYDENVSLFKAYDEKENLYIVIHFNERKSNDYLLTLAYFYYGKYDKPIYMEVSNYDQIIYLNINKEGIATFN